MKKNLLLALMVLSTFTSLADARFFLGIDGGYSMDRVDVKTEDKLDKTTGAIKEKGTFIKDAYLGNGYLFNINLGTEHHFDENHYIGFRWFLSGGYGRTTLINQSDKSIKYPSNIIEANLGVDLLLDVIKFGNNSLGVFGGVEGGIKGTVSDAYCYNNISHYKEYILNSFAPSISSRIGISLFLAEHHRIEFVTKIPVYVVIDDNNYKPLQFMLGYKFIF